MKRIDAGHIKTRMGKIQKIVQTSDQQKYYFKRIHYLDKINMILIGMQNVK